MKTNEEAKQEAIKNAWGYLYHGFMTRGAIDSEGYVNWGRYFIQDVTQHPSELGFDPDKDIQWNGTRWRPVSLIGISSNNDWIRIEPYGNNLPTDGTKMYKCIDIHGRIVRTDYTLDDVIQDVKMKMITHYKPIQEEKPPIY